ncbi:cell wall-binding repeat-containing protein [Bacillus sp. RAR_GA_16]|uniref:cell wall-binding repeat-containing protein n=1 Tax=Bacillus sp. RAR_GA_16 TaxID=2876774 RepID=UPI001CCB07FC|nr:cell wall-binding repeat-containing protein [Bacillus sp. RAR_GA_16]MCA0172801.1 cell wall-binding repeat-containing protein [Bacillus sp. RAR_GA_16]
MKKSLVVSFFLLIVMLLHSPSFASAEKYIVIDPGHGGRFTGTSGYSGTETGFYEKVGTLEIGLKLKEKLKDTDINVFMTRKTDRDFATDSKEDLIERMKIANGYVKGNNDNSLFISIHHNAYPFSTLVKGYETYYYSKAAAWDEEYPPDPIQVNFESESRRLASIVHPQVLNKTGLLDKGIQNDQAFFVIRNAQMPSVLVELGYMSNPSEESLIKTSRFQNDAAEALAQAAINFFKVFEVKDSSGKEIKQFTSRDDAITFAKTLNNVTVFDKDKQETIYDSTKVNYDVYSKGDHKAVSFTELSDAINYAKDRKNTKVIDKKNGFIKWSNYLTRPYQIRSKDGSSQGSYFEKSQAISAAKTMKEVKVVNRSSADTLWTNISGEQVTKSLNVKALVGSDRFETAVKISKEIYPEGFKDNKNEKTVVLTNGLGYADALSVGPLAAQLGNAPILLTRGASLDSFTKQEIQRLGAEKVLLIGGKSAISATVEKQVKGLGVTTERIGGVNRYETNIMINERLDHVEGVFVANGLSYADALASSPIASASDWAILLTDKRELSTEALSYVKGKETAILGGEAVISSNLEEQLKSSNGSNVKRLSGETRYETLAAILNEYSNEMESDTVLLSIGQNFPDALVSSSLAVQTGAPLILVHDELNSSVQDVLFEYGMDNRVTSLFTIGGKVQEKPKSQVANRLY